MAGLHRLRRGRSTTLATAEEPIDAEVVFEVLTEDPLDTLAVFRRIKEGPSLSDLRAYRKDLQSRLGRVQRGCVARSNVLARTGDPADFDKLQSSQGFANRLRRQIVDVTEQIEQFKHNTDSPATELEAIALLPQVIGIRAETPETLVITVVASAPLKGKYYHLGTWDIYFGKLEGLGIMCHDFKQTLDVPLRQGSGDMPHYRVRRAIETRVEYTETTYHNWPDGSFCFGNNREAIEKLAKDREYLHAIQVMVTYLSWCKGSKLDNLPKYFRPLEERDLRR
ncbi:MAG: hypothetical protein JWO07_836 [Candidatus Saccharibacteria bacterium]|nr:hypothetical protein [Candidatus Saccharibacteria bacterium]